MLGAVGLIFWEIPYQGGGGLGTEHAGGIMTNTASLLLPGDLLWHYLVSMPAGSPDSQSLSQLNREKSTILFHVLYPLPFFFFNLKFFIW